jgi:hypothetical protein
VTIELLHPSTNVGACALPCVVSSDQWTVSSAVVAPGGHVDAHDALAIAISDVDMGAPLRGGPGTFAMTKGTLTNNGSADARLVLLEFGASRTQANRPVEQRDSAASTRRGAAFK